jgi:hypothetical protein
MCLRKTNMAPLTRTRVPLTIRLAAALFCLGFVFLFWVFLGLVNHFGSSLFHVLLKVLLGLMIAVFAVYGVLQLFGVDIFRPLMRR